MWQGCHGDIWVLVAQVTGGPAASLRPHILYPPCFRPTDQPSSPPEKPSLARPSANPARKAPERTPDHHTPHILASTIRPDDDARATNAVAHGTYSFSAQVGPARIAKDFGHHTHRTCPHCAHARVTQRVCFQWPPLRGRHPVPTQLTPSSALRRRLASSDALQLRPPHDRPFAKPTPLAHCVSGTSRSS